MFFLHFFFNAFDTHTEGTKFQIFTTDGGKTKIYNYNGGDNSFEETLLAKPQATKLVVTFLGSGAVTGLKSYDCVDEGEFVG